MYFFIRSKLNRMVMDIKDQKAEPNAPVVTDRQVKDGHITQFWEFVLGEIKGRDRETELYYIRNNMHAFVIDLKGFNKRPEAEVVVFPQKCDEADNQLWELVHERGPWYKIRNKFSKAVLEIKDAKRRAETPVVASPAVERNDDHQLWELVPACPEARD